MHAYCDRSAPFCCRDALAPEAELLIQACKLVDGSDAVLIIDDTAMPMKGMHSIGVASQYVSTLGKAGNVGLH